MSPTKDLGKKYSCWKCEKKFYDLNKAVPLCPGCGADQRESPALKASDKGRKAPKAVAAPPPPPPRAKPAAVVDPIDGELEETEVEAADDDLDDEDDEA